MQQFDHDYNVLRPVLKNVYFKLIYAFSENLNLPCGLEKNHVEIRNSVVTMKKKMKQGKMLQKAVK